jgi:hypothetical protein
MGLVSFTMKKSEKTNHCFEWSLDDDGEHVGCYLDPKDKDKFRDIVCRVLKTLLNDENIRDHLKLCKELQGIPIYKDNKETGSTSSGVSSKMSHKS